MYKKAEILAELEGFESPEILLEYTIHESVVPGICINEHCDYTDWVEPDCSTGYCEDCKTNSIQSINVLMGIL